MARAVDSRRELDSVFELEVQRLLWEKGYDVTRHPKFARMTFRPDFIAQRREGGRPQRIAVEVKAHLNFKNIHKVVGQAKVVLGRAEPPLDQYWIIVSAEYSNIVEAEGVDKRIRIWRIDELRHVLGNGKKPTAKTRIGKSVQVNEKEIQLAISGLMLQIEAKLEALRDERPNSPDAVAQHNAQLTNFERMKAELERIRELVAAFKKGKAPEKDVVKATKTFRQGIEQWWTDKSGEILTSTAKGAVLVSSIGLLALMKADSVAAITAVATVVNGGAILKAKQIGKAVKRIAKRALASEDDGAVQ